MLGRRKKKRKRKTLCPNLIVIGDLNLCFALIRDLCMNVLDVRYCKWTSRSNIPLYARVKQRFLNQGRGCPIDSSIPGKVNEDQLSEATCGVVLDCQSIDALGVLVIGWPAISHDCYRGLVYELENVFFSSLFDCMHACMHAYRFDVAREGGRRSVN